MGLVKWEHIVRKDGEIVTNILERGGVECSQISQHATQGLGKELSDERTGPECDDVHETQL